MNAEHNKRQEKRGRGKPAETQRKKAESRLNRLLLRLIASAVIFLLVFVGGRLIPERAVDVFGVVRQTVSTDLNLSASVETIGNSIRAGESIPAALREWCVDTFLPVSVNERAENQVQEELSAGKAYHSHLIAPRIDVPALKRT